MIPKGSVSWKGHVGAGILGIVERLYALSSPLQPVCREFVTGFPGWTVEFDIRIPTFLVVQDQTIQQLALTVKLPLVAVACLRLSNRSK
jgi:hypothetical protein